MDKNPFAWDNSSSDLNSKTVKKVVTRKRFKRSVSKVSFASMTKTFDFIYIQELKQARRRPLRKLEM